MYERGRPPVTRARVLTYIARHPGCSVMQIVRGTGAERSHVYRILKLTFGNGFREKIASPEFYHITQTVLAA